MINWKHLISFSFSAGKKAAQVSQLITRSAAFRQSSSDNSAYASDDGRQPNNMPSYKPATGTTSEEWTSDQDDLEPHNSAGKLEHEKCSELGSR